DVEGLLRREVLAHEAFDLVAQRLVLEDRDLHVEDRGLRLAGLLRGTLLDGAQALDRLFRRIAEALDLGVDLAIWQDAYVHIWHFPAQQLRGSDHDARRCGYAPEFGWHGLVLLELGSDQLGERFHRFLGV